MTLTFCWDLAPADWIAHSNLPAAQLIRFGPAGFEAYARLRLLPDPAHPGQSENDAEEEDWRVDQLPRLLAALARHTTTPDDCYFCVWEGFGRDTVHTTTDTAVYVHSDTSRFVPLAARPGLAPAPPAGSTTHLPRVVVPHRAYWLFRGPLADVGTWNTAQGWPSAYRLDNTEPAFVWPADHAWCVTSDVDPHWAGIGAHRAVITRLASEPRLDVVLADPAQDQPAYR